MKYWKTILALLALSFVVVAYARAQTPAPSLLGHPLIGIAHVCEADTGQPFQCQDVMSPQGYDTQAQCEADMVHRLQEFADQVHADHPHVDIQAQYACVINHTQEV